MTTIAIISDTHIPSRAERIPAWVEDEIRTADWTIHAGDFDSEGALRTVDSMASGRLIAVAGNTDPGTLDLPSVAMLDADPVRFVVTHGTGDPDGYKHRLVAAARVHAGSGVAVGIGGHSHRVLDTTVDGIRILNPGSATGAWPAARESMMLAAVDADGLAVRVLDGE